MRKKLKYILFLFGFVLLVFTGIELWMYYLLRHPDSCPESWVSPLHEYYTYHDINILQYERGKSQWDKELLYILKPGEFEHSNHEFSNVYHVIEPGLRDDAASMSDPRIISIGDSYCMGWGVDQEETYTEILEKRLGRPTLNAGISSYGTAREMALLERLPTDSMDYLIIQHCNNDREENRAWALREGKPEYRPASDYELAVRDMERRMSYYPFKYTLELFPLLLRGEDGHPETTASEDSLRKVDPHKAFLDIIKSCKAIHGHTRILVFTLGVKGFNDHFMEGVQKQLDQEFGSTWQDRIHFLDMSDMLEAEDYYVWDAHLRPSGHRKVADSLEAWFRRPLRGAETREWKYEDGNIAIRSRYVDGLKEGLTEYFWPSGAPSRHSQYHRGSRVGSEYDFAENGDTIAVRD